MSWQHSSLVVMKQLTLMISWACRPLPMSREIRQIQRGIWSEVHHLQMHECMNRVYNVSPGAHLSNYIHFHSVYWITIGSSSRMVWWRQWYIDIPVKLAGCNTQSNPRLWRNRNRVTYCCWWDSDTERNNRTWINVWNHVRPNGRPNSRQLIGH